MTPAHSCFKSMSVRQKILLIFLILSVISLLITGIVAFVTIWGIGDLAEKSSLTLGGTAIHQSKVSLQQEAEKDLQRIASDQAEITDVIFFDTNSEMEILAAQAASLQNNTPLIPSVPSFTTSASPRDPFNSTVILLAPGSTAIPPSDEYRTLAGMDDLLMAVQHADTDMASVYVATDSGILRSNPWCTFEPGYDPRDRDWFTRAKSSSSVAWSKPYVDASGNGLMITGSHAVPTKYGTWVIASDITIETIKQEILNLALRGTGYALLIDNEGNVISSPNQTAGNTTWDEAFASHNIFDSSDPDLVKTGRNMVAGKTGMEHIWIDGQETYIAYAPVPSMNWSFAIAKPASQVMAPSMETEGAILSATQSTSKNIDAQTTRILGIFVGLFCILLIIVIVLSVMLSKIITRPVEILKQGTVAIGNGDLDYHLTIETGDEFEALAHSFNTMAGDLKKNIEHLRRTTAEKERYAKEMEIAKEIQDNFLPESAPAIPGIELAAATLPAMEIGGDLYDFIPVKGNRWGIAIADVSGKGVSAALFMALSRTLIRITGSAEADPSVVLQQANRLIFEDGRSSMFITVFYGVLDPEKMTFTYGNAGHNLPLLVRGNPPEIRILEDGRCIALGVVPEVTITPGELALQPGDLIVMYTDGVTEAFNPRDEEFGEERLADFIRDHRDAPVQQIIDDLLEELKRFFDNAPQSDDITLVVIRVK
ncbi:MAG: serine/threonine protein phosphatase [Methanomicrobiales archaeon HGW-Methanomicrobiales-1]|jgi:sigma-B regulation protein RsbU (phosphoserine phosphatase)|nr:MAG: serine/threonine protein phosphatase [Methanomicrobiales archaeon HGW-Methanomicrobiales-1]